MKFKIMCLIQISYISILTEQLLIQGMESFFQEAQLHHFFQAVWEIFLHTTVNHHPFIQALGQNYMTYPRFVSRKKIFYN